jgi:hypothetical protein
MQALVNVGKSLTGAGVNEPVEPFSAPLDRLLEFPLRQGLLFFVLAGVAVVFGLRDRDPRPAVWFTAAAVLGVMAEARLAATHYFAPAFVVSLPGALWLLRRRRGAVASLLVWPVIAWAVWPHLEHRHGPTRDAEAFAARAAPALAFMGDRLAADEVGLTPSYWPHPDTRYWEVVELYVAYTPDYPYRFLPASRIAAERAGEQGKRLRYDADFGLGESASEELVLGDIGTFRVRPVAPDVVELLEGPGVREPLPPG